MISSIHQSITALNAFGRKMQVKSNNLANVQTVGFKSSDGFFQDLPSHGIATAASAGQVGMGSALADILASFAQGPFERTANSMDMAIGGNGFFVLRDAGSDSPAYSRAGNFHFDGDGYLTNPEGYVVQGWQLDSNGNPMGDMGDIRMPSYTSPPGASSELRMILNLDSSAEGGGGVLETAWDGTLPSGSSMAEGRYEYSSTVSLMDASGEPHDVTLFFDKNSQTQWDFLVTCNPAEDARGGAAGTPCAGLLARGTMSFGAGSGTLSPSRGLTLETFTGADWSSPADPANWNGSTPNSEGYPGFPADFMGAGTAGDSIALNFGTRYNGTSWDNESLTTTQFSRPSTTVYQSTDGFGPGDLEWVTVDGDGVIEGRYSNGEVLPLFRVAEARFVNPQGLKKEGGNIFRATSQSGEAAAGIAGTNGLGRIAPQSLEMSNVDMAKEITDTIPLQRGYEANLRVIKTKDEMLGSLLDILG